MKPICTQEIEFASKLLFDGDKSKFYDDIKLKTGERIDVIKSLESIDVNACPGSGKTTVLLAKLIILSNRMPFEDGRGICVLTHTNVAIDLIKEKLGVGASKLFSYPNFFGTIQSFVDQFLAVPALIDKYGVRPNVVDNDKANAILIKGYFEGRTKLYYKIFFSLFARHSRVSQKSLCELLQIEKKEAKEVVLYLKKLRILESTNSLSFENTKKPILEKEMNSHPQSEKITQSILTIREHAINLANNSSSHIELLQKLRIDYLNNRITEYDEPFCGFETESGKAFLKIKESCYLNGLITFSDAYKLGEYYLNKYPEINLAFKERFKYVFVDEMQDTAKHQIEIINALFKKGNKSIVQYYGDPNQAIFESEGQKDGGWNPSSNEPTTLNLRKSKRFGTELANTINPIRIFSDKDNLIEGDNPESNIKPHLILFDKDDSTKILDIFGDILISKKLHEIENAKFVGIGRVGKEHPNGELSLKSYFNEFEKSTTKKKEFHQHLIAYLSNIGNNKKQIKHISDRIINAILHTVDIHDFKNEVINKKKADKEVVYRKFSKTTFLNFLKYKHEEIYFLLKENLIIWANKISLEEVPFNISVKEEIEKFLSEKILPLKGKKLKKSNDFFNIPLEIKSVIEANEKNGEFKANLSKNNIYKYKYSVEDVEQELPIKINTIHGEKGETHTATLYMETYFKSYDSGRIKEQLLGTHFKPQGPEINMAIKMAYVAMSRPKYLLCFAIQKINIQDILDDPIKKKKLESIWTLIDV